MPNLKKHCKNSKDRTGDEHKELHKWMDEPQKELGINHRTERHDASSIEEVRERFGGKAIKEFLKHIAEDYEFTSERWGLSCVYCGNSTWHSNKLCNKCIRLLDKENKK